MHHGLRGMDAPVCFLYGLTLKTKVSLKTGFSVFRWTFVSYFFFLSGRMKTLT